MSNEELVNAIRAGGDRPRLMGELYEQNRPLITKTAQAFCGRLEFDDAMQEAYMSLSWAVDEYNPRKGCKFSTFYNKALRWHLFRASCRFQGVPEYAIEDAAALEKFRHDYYKDHGKRPDDDTAAFVLAWDHKRLKRAKEWARIRWVSLDKPIGEDGDTLGDLIAGDGHELAELEEAAAKDQAGVELWQFVDALPERERQAIRGKYQDNKTLKEIGEDLSVTPERSRQIIADGMRRLRQPGHAKRIKEAVSDAYGITLNDTSLTLFKQTGESSVERAARHRAALASNSRK